MRFRPGFGFILILLQLISGCASYGGIAEKGRHQISRGELEQAYQHFDKTLPDKGPDQLLRYLELGMVAFREGRYEDSNQLLETAYVLSDYLYAPSLSELIHSSLTSSRALYYRGRDSERAFILILKLMNYIELAQQTGDNGMNDEALVEVRRLNILMSRLDIEYGDYNTAAEKNGSLAGQLMKILRLLSGNWSDPEKLRYRSDPFAEYLAAVAYQQNHQQDDARISYQSALKAYRSGAIEQYGLSPALTGMIENNLEQLKKTDTGSAELVLVQYSGLVPPKGEMNLYARLSPGGSMLDISPVPLGTFRQQQEQLSWFMLQYGDTGVLDLLGRYLSGGINETVSGVIFHKRIPLLPVWKLVEQTGLDQVLRGGIRVTVPYYSSADLQHHTSARLHWQEQSWPLLRAASPEQVVVQEQIRMANQELRLALLRELFKTLMSSQLAGAVDPDGKGAGMVVDIAGRIFSAATARADTRSWLTLPGEIYMQRITLPAGHQSLELVTQAGADTIRQKIDVTLKAGEVRLMPVFTLNENMVTEVAY